MHPECHEVSAVHERQALQVEHDAVFAFEDGPPYLPPVGVGSVHESVLVVVDGERDDGILHGYVSLQVDLDDQLLPGKEHFRGGAVRPEDLGRHDLDLLRSPVPAVGEVLTTHQPPEVAHHVVRIPLVHDPTLVQDDGSIADPNHLVGGVCDEHDGASLLLELFHLVQTLTLERDVTDGEDLIHEENGGIHVHGHGESQTDVHPRRIELHLVVYEVLELGEGHDVVEHAVGLLAGQPQERSIQVHVLPTGQLNMEPLLHVDRYVLQSQQFLGMDADADDPLLDRGGTFPVSAEPLADILDGHGRGHRRTPPGSTFTSLQLLREVPRSVEEPPPRQHEQPQRADQDQGQDAREPGQADRKKDGMVGTGRHHHTVQNTLEPNDDVCHRVRQQQVVEGDAEQVLPGAFPPF